MRKLNEVMPTLSTPYTPEPGQRLDSARTMKVWAQLAEMFGKAFYREHGTEPSPLWHQAVARLSDNQIAMGLANLANDGLEFPANLPQFVAACKRVPPVRQLGTDCKALPAPGYDEKEAEKAWAQMEKLAGRPLRNSG